MPRFSISWCVPLAVAVFAVSTAHAQGGTLRIGAMRAQEDQVVLPIVLSGGDNQVAALDFRLEYDPSVFRPIAAESGPAATQANKVVTANSPSPGDYVVVMMGLNQTTVAQGEVARVIMERVSTPANGQSELVIHDSTLATPEGVVLPSRGMRRTVDFNTPEDPTDDPALDIPDTESPAGPQNPNTPPDGTADAPTQGGGDQPGAGGGPLGGIPPLAASTGPSQGASGEPRAGLLARNARPEARAPGTDDALAAAMAEANALRAGLPSPLSGDTGTAAAGDSLNPATMAGASGGTEADGADTDKTNANNHLAAAGGGLGRESTLAGAVAEGSPTPPGAPQTRLIWIYAVGAIFLLACGVFLGVKYTQND